MDDQKKRYIKLWAVLLFALFVSLGLGEINDSTLAIAVIFLIAGIKALLVVAFFMHLNIEPKWIKVLEGSALALVLALFVGLYLDVVKVYGKMPAISTQAHAANPTTPNKPSTTNLANNKHQSTTKKGDAKKGEKVFSSFCIACHQADGKGLNGALAPDFITDKSRLKKSDKELLTSIRNGITGKTGTMPPWGKVISEKQQADVLAYIRKAFGETLKP